MAIDNLDEFLTDLDTVSELSTEDVDLDWDEVGAMELEVRAHVYDHNKERTVEHVIADIEVQGNVLWINLGGEILDAS